MTTPAGDTKATIDASIKQLSDDLAFLKENGATRDDVAQYEQAIKDMKTDVELKFNELNKKLEEEAKAAQRRALGLFGGGSDGVELKNVGKMVSSADAVRAMAKDRDKRSAIVEFKGGLHKSLKAAHRAQMQQRAITDLDASGLIFEYQDMSDVAVLDRFFEPGIRMLIPSIDVPGKDTARFSQLKNVHHYAVELASQASSGQKDVVLVNAEGLKPGSSLTISVGEAEQEVAVVDTIDHDTNTATMVANLTNTHPALRLAASDDLVVTPKGKILPKAKLVWDSAICTIKKLGFTLDVTLEEMNDADRFAQEINLNLPPMLARQFDKAVLYGIGGERDFDGVLSDATIPLYSWSDGKPGDTTLDAIRRAMTLARKGQHRPDLIHVAPDDLEVLELTKADTGRYIEKLVIVNGVLTVWRTPLREDHALVAKDYLIANWRIGARIYDSEQAEITVSTENKDNFERDMATLKIRERLGLAIREPKSFVRGKFDSAPVA